MSRAAPEAYATGRLTERRLRPIRPPPAASPQTSQTTRSSGIPSATSPCEVWSFPPCEIGRPSSKRVRVTKVVSRIGTASTTAGTTTTAKRLRDNPGAGESARPASTRPVKSDPLSPMKMRAGG